MGNSVGITGEGVVNIQNTAARITENRIHILLQQAFDEDLCAG